MPIVSLAAVKDIPQIKNQGEPFLNRLIEMADKAIKAYLKRDIEQAHYTEYYSGDGHRDIVLRQRPLVPAATTIAAASNGVALPTATINVASTADFFNGSGTIAVQTGTNSWTTATYTGKTDTSFTGCAGGTGTLSTGNRIRSPIVFYDANGYYGSTPSGFPASSIVVEGTEYAVLRDSGGTKSNRSMLRKISGTGASWIGFYPESLWSGKLAARKLAFWPRGDGNIKVIYTAGYEEAEMPADIQAAAIMLIGIWVRMMPMGQLLTSEGLGAYSYSLGWPPQGTAGLGTIERTLAPHREVSW